MQRVVKALTHGENALLESPTGTGKTLSLLCASLAWLKRERERNPVDPKAIGPNGPAALDVPRIIYTSRTHSQLAQVQKELANTAYNPRSLVVGSRDHFCIHPQISLLRGFLLNTACKKAQKSLDPCAFYKNREFAKQTMSWEPLDIEELHEIGKKQLICPYFANKDRISGADVVFMPYNYLIDEKIRENFDIRYENACIIFDEAHNVAQCAEDVTSFELKSKLLEGVVLELQKLQDERRLDEDRAWDASEEDVDCLIEIAK
jgi:regulator of telomere elongation helicase 1